MLDFNREIGSSRSGKDVPVGYCTAMSISRAEHLSENVPLRHAADCEEMFKTCAGTHVKTASGVMDQL